ncbi:MAG: hydrogenase maturation nickel metallochaperone HypA [Rhodospirillales bacterium]
MHELALCQSVVDLLRREATARQFSRVTLVRLQIGAFSCASAEALEFCFEAVTKGTLAEGAHLDLVRVPGRAWCMNCGETVTIRERTDCCPQCGGYELNVTGGDELRVQELEVL